MLPQHHIDGLVTTFVECLPRFITFYIISTVFIGWAFATSPNGTLLGFIAAESMLWCWMVFWEAIGYFMSFYSKILSLKFVTWLERKGWIK